MEFISYNKSTGVILTHSIVPLESLPADTEEVGYLECQYSGETHVTNGIPVVQPPTSDELFTRLRKTRDQLLSNTDWTQSPDVLSRSVLTQTQVEAFGDYRQALRDLPGNTTDPANPSWPQAPVITKES